MTAAANCPNCEKPLPPDAPRGLCPACLARAALDSDSDLNNRNDSGPPLPAYGSVVQALGAPPIQLREPTTEAAAPLERPNSPEVPDFVPMGLQLHGEIARGGMGAILKGRDVDLGRDIAVKVLLETHQGRTELVQRFVEEAQISGQLQHPGVVPVYELGQFADKRPYFTMKLVKGKTLAKLLQERMNDEGGRMNRNTAGSDSSFILHPSSFSPDLPRFIEIFLKVCQTLAYAHARGVIHRDLKPSNVMVGNFGEVQVMDWGLAKVLKEGGVADEQSSRARQQQAVSVIQTQRSQGSSPAEFGSDTQAGSVLGTPGYMAPEQARGEIDLVDERSDVFGLGAILCEILTGQPPFTGKNAEAMRKAQTAKLDEAFSRLDDCSGDPELIALAKRCLAAEPWDRLRDAGEVAAAVAAYQHSVTERLRQAELACAAEVARTEEARATAAQERKAREAADALALSERRGKRLTLGLAASILVLAATSAAGGLWIQQHRADRAAELARQHEAVETALDKVSELQKSARWKEAEAVLAQVENQIGETGTADLRARIEQSRADFALVGRLDSIRQKRATTSGGYFDLQSSDQDYAAAFRDVGLGQDGQEPETVGVRIRGSAIREQLVAALEDWASVAAEPSRRSWIWAVAQAADPNDWRNRFRDPAIWDDKAKLEQLAKEVLEGPGEKLNTLSPQFLTALGNALIRVNADAAPLLKVAQEHYPSDFWLNLRLGFALKQQAGSIGYNRAAIALRPDSEVAHNNLAGSLVISGQFEEAIRECKIAIKLDPNYASPHSNLGVIFLRKNQLDDAIREYQTAIRLSPKWANFHVQLGNALLEKGEFDKAIQVYRRAIELDPNSSDPHGNLGNTLVKIKHMEEAIQEYRLAMELNPKDAAPHHNLANYFHDIGKEDDAIREYETAISLEPKLAAPHNGLANCIGKKGQLVAAILEYRKAIELDSKVSIYHSNLAESLRDQGRLDEAIHEYRIAIALDPNRATRHSGLGHALWDKGELEEAVREHRLACKLEPTSAEHRNALGLDFQKKRQFDAAIQEFRFAIKLDPNYALAYYNLGNIFREKGEPNEAIENYRKAISLDPKIANSHLGLGNALFDKGQLDEGIAEYRRAIELKPNDATFHDNLGHALYQKKQFAEAASQFRIAIILDAKSANMHYDLAVALKDGGQLEEAITEYRMALHLDPKLAYPHDGLASIAAIRQDWDGTIAEAQKAIELDPKFVLPYSKLGVALQQKGMFEKARDTFKQAIKLSPEKDPQYQLLHRLLQECERLLGLDQKLTKILNGKDKPADDTERILLADLCAKPYKKQYAAALRFLTEAMDHDPKLAGDCKTSCRYNAACVAVLIAAGQDAREKNPSVEEREKLIKKALVWLREDLAAWTKLAEDPKEHDLVLRAVSHWQKDADLVTVRNAKEVGRLLAEEQHEWKKLWADVAELLNRVEEKPK
jgi:serine/threonine-protein kinase